MRGRFWFSLGRVKSIVIGLELGEENDNITQCGLLHRSEEEIHQSYLESRTEDARDWAVIEWG
jgi:hypothetical protein